jgi:hypothetical protein
VIDRLLETGRVPEPMLRAGIRATCRVRLARERARDPTDAFAGARGRAGIPRTN